ncbi:hypothetical protein KI387_034853, partial [Taxus chinensis]
EDVVFRMGPTSHGGHERGAKGVHFKHHQHFEEDGRGSGPDKTQNEEAGDS